MVQNSLRNSNFSCKPDAISHHKPTQNNLLQSLTLEVIKGLNLKAELCGSWLWIFKADDSHQAQLIAANFKWSCQKGAWYFCSNKNAPRFVFKQTPAHSDGKSKRDIR